MSTLYVQVCGLLLVAGLPLHSVAQTPRWSQFPGSPSGTTPRNDDITFVNELWGWSARGTDGIHRTTNSGATFQKVLSSTIAYPGTNVVAHFRSIAFASATRGWAGNLGPGSYDASVTDTNILHETFDGGGTWAPVMSVSATDIKGLCAMQVLDAQHIYGGGRVRGPAHFIKSTDGGATWLVTNLTAAGVMGGIMDVHFHDAQNGFLLGMSTNTYAAGCALPYNGRIVRTTDGGATWTPVAETPVQCSYFWKFAWPSTDVGYATLQQNAAHDTVIFYKTVDGGATWTSNGIPLSAIGSSSFFLQGIGFVSETEGWMGGSSTVAAPFNFIHTTDGGLTWTVAGYDNTQSINKIRFLNSQFGYASGRKLHVYRVPLAITAQPTNVVGAPGGNAIFTVTAQGLGTLDYQWRFGGNPLSGATSSTLVLTDIGPGNVGGYDVVVSDVSGSVTSALATLTVPGIFLDDFDGFETPSVVTSGGVHHGYQVRFNAASGPADFTAIFGFDYSAVVFPTSIPPAPRSTEGTTRGLYLTVNKDGTDAAAAVNLYPINGPLGSNVSLKFDLWLNWASGSVSTEHALAGIHHSGTIPNRPGNSPSDGLFFAIAADGGVSATAATIRDYAVFRGRELLTPLLMTTNNTAFGPVPPLGPNFDGSDPGMVALFPSRAVEGWGNTPPGSAGLQWLTVEVRQSRDLVTWAVNGSIIVQYTNTYDFANGTVMIGYLDFFSSTSFSANFAVVDNLSVEPVIEPPLELAAPRLDAGEFLFRFTGEPYVTYAVQWTTNLAAPAWTTLTTLLGNGAAVDIAVPLNDSDGGGHYFRVTR